MDNIEGKDEPLQDEHCETKDFSNPVYRELSLINGRINSMTKSQLIANLNKLQLDANGNVSIMRKRLKNHFRMQKFSSNNLKVVSMLFPFYVVIDFEATCELCNPHDFPHEIIEFPAILVDSETQTIVDEFHSYVKPVQNPELSDFCTELTGITQETVDKSEEFPAVLRKFQKWLRNHELDTKNKFAVVTDGPCDMGRFLVGQCNISNIPFPAFAKRWINIRRVFRSYYRSRKLCLSSMLQSFGVEFDGRLHCGLDDARNIAILLILMIKDGVSLDINENIQKNHMMRRDKNKRLTVDNGLPSESSPVKGSTTLRINKPWKHQPQHQQNKNVEESIDENDLDFALGLMSVRNEAVANINDSE